VSRAELREALIGDRASVRQGLVKLGPRGGQVHGGDLDLSSEPGGHEPALSGGGRVPTGNALAPLRWGWKARAREKHLCITLLVLTASALLVSCRSPQSPVALPHAASLVSTTTRSLAGGRGRGPGAGVGARAQRGSTQELTNAPPSSCFAAACCRSTIRGQIPMPNKLGHLSTTSGRMTKPCGGFCGAPRSTVPPAESRLESGPRPGPTRRRGEGELGLARF